MGKLVYWAVTSLDGFVADDAGSFDWAEPDDEVHRFANDLERTFGTHLLGRRMYQVMVFWETYVDSEGPQVMRDFAVGWRAADKIVYSSTLQAVSSARTRIEPRFDPDDVRRLKESSASDLSVGGPTLAAHALEAGLVDECHLIVAPIIVGGGQHWLPGRVRVGLQLLDERRFGNGMVYLRYRLAAN